MNRDAFGRDQIGWVHSHYELGVPDYSQIDLENQKLWCGKPWQCGLLVLVDGGKLRIRCYRGPESVSLGPVYRYGGAAGPITEKRTKRRYRQIPKAARDGLVPWPTKPPTWFSRLRDRLASNVWSVARCTGALAYGVALRCGLAAYAGLRAATVTLLHGVERPTTRRDNEAVSLPKLTNKGEATDGDDV